MSNILMNTSETISSTDLPYIGAKLLEVREEAGKKFVFVQASGAVAKYDVVIVDEAGQAASVTLTTSASAFGDRVAVAPVAFADNDYGWMQIYGPANVNVLASCGANKAINTTATAGTLDDDATAGSEVISGLVLTTARSTGTGLAPAMLNHPTVGATL